MVIYVASPYSHANKPTMQWRFYKAEEFVADAIKLGHNVYSPIVHSHNLALKYDLPKDCDFWEQHNNAFIDVSSELWVLQLPEWEVSRGVKREVDRANEIVIPIRWIPYSRTKKRCVATAAVR